MLATRAADAQVGYQPQSLEWLTASSAVVVRASVAEVRRSAVRDDRAWVALVLTVSETLKGAPARSITVAEEHLDSYRVYDEWRDAGREQLWFLVRNEQYGDRTVTANDGIAARYPLRPYGRGWSVIRLGPPTPAERGFVALPPPIFTIDLGLLREPKEIIAAARASVRAGGTVREVQSHLLWLPRCVVERSGRSGDFNHLVVPVDRRLERLARRLIRLPLTYIPPSTLAPTATPEERRQDDTWRRSEASLLRAEGIKALGHFRSQASVWLLRQLLRDPAVWQVSRDAMAGESPVMREYYVGRAAYEMLRDWGVPVREPMLFEPLR